MAAKKPLVIDFTTGNFQQLQTGDFIDIAQGGTGSTTASGALTALGAYPVTNPNNFISASGAPVQSVAGRTGSVVLSQADITGLKTTDSVTFDQVTAVNFFGYLDGNARAAGTLNGGTVYSLVYQGSPGTTAFLPAGTNGQILQTRGTGGGSPQWIDASSLTLGSVQIVSGLGFTPANNAKLGAVNGIATLDASGKLTSSQIPASLLGAVQYQGVWNASTNTPTITSGTGTKGQYYKVFVAGATNIDGNSNWAVGDIIIYNGTTWDAVDGAVSEVSSVAGRVGAVVLSQADISGLTTSSSPTFTAVTATTFTGALVGNANTATSLAGGTAYSLPYQSSAGTSAFLAAGTDGYVLQTHSTTSAPTWVNAATLAPVQTVAGRTGSVTLSQSDISGLTTASSPTFAAVTATTFTGSLNGDASTSYATTSKLSNGGAASLPICSVVYNDATGAQQAANANAVGTSSAIGLLQAATGVGAMGSIVTNGELSATVAQWQAVGAGASGLTPGAQYFLSNTTAGAITTTPPTTGFLVRVGTALSATKMLVSIGCRIQL